MPPPASRWRRVRVLLVLVGMLVVTAVATRSSEPVQVADPPAAATLPAATTPSAEVVASPSPTGTTTPGVAAAPDLQAGIDAATREAAQAGATVEIAVLDRNTRQEWTNGDPADEPVWVASLAKLFMADNLLHRQQLGQLRLSAADRELLEAMLTVSDDSAARTLYDRYGGPAMITEVAERYGLPTLTPTNQPPYWELTSIGAIDLVRWYDAFLNTAAPGDVDFVVSELRASPELAADGFDQYFGIPRAQPGQVWAIKQGWMCCPRDSAFLHTSGLLGPDNRYAVAILVQLPGAGTFPVDLLDRLTALILPPGLLT